MLAAYHGTHTTEEADAELEATRRAAAWQAMTDAAVAEVRTIAATSDALERLAADATNQHTPEAVSVFVVTDSEDMAREVGPMLARVLYPDRGLGAVLHVEPITAEVSGFEVAVHVFGTPLSAVKVGR